MKAAVHTSYGPPEVVRIAEVDKPATKDNERAGQGSRDDGEPDRLRVPGGQAVHHATLHRAHSGHGRRFWGMSSRESSRRSAAASRSFEVGDRVFGYNEGPFGAHAEYLSIPEDGSLATMPANLTYEQAAPSTEGSHYALSHHQGGKDPERAGRPGQRRDRSHRLGGGPAAEEPRCQRDRGLRHGARGAGQGLGRRPGHRLHGRGLHEGRADATTWSWTRSARARSAGASRC